MHRKPYYFVSESVGAAILLLCAAAAYGQTQTPGQVTKFDPSLNVVDSVITEDPTGNVGIGTTTPAAALDVASGDLNLSGNILKGGELFIHNFGYENTFVGRNAGNLTMTGDGNTACGDTTLLFNTLGTFNTAIGAYALDSNTFGNGNTVIGEAAMITNTRGSNNTATGNLALHQNESGNLNTASGLSALYNLISGDRNIAIGSDAGGFLATGSDNVYIGHRGNVLNESNTMYLGEEGVHTRFVVAGVKTTEVTGLPVKIDANGQLGVQSAFRRFKEDVRDMGQASDGLQRLRPVTFYYKQAPQDGLRQLQYGLIAEEVAAVYPELVEYSEEGEPFAVRYHLLGAMLLDEVQKQDRQLREQQQQIQAQAAHVAELQAQLAAVAGLLQQRER